jgi:dTDP-4-dehydrorhamnose reductase
VKILVFGPTGQLGTDVVSVFRARGEDVLPVTRELADLRDRTAVGSLLDRERPDAVVNCAAFHDPAGCEEDPELAFAVNAAAVEVLAQQCSQISAKLMTVSTDYVFDGTKVGGYREDDEPNPLNRYGESKLAGEQLARAAHDETFVVRTQSLFGLTGPRGKGSNFVDLMLRLAEERDELKVDGFRMAPTGTVPLAENMHALLATSEFGLYHMSCQGETTWYEFARAILERVGSRTRVTQVPNDFYPTTFRRPENTYLINAALEARGLDEMPHWDDALGGYLEAKGVALPAGGDRR